MKGSEFVSSFAHDKSPLAWESAAIRLAKEGGLMSWPMLPVSVVSPDGKHQGVFFAASDYVAVGTPDDYVRLPLTPIAGQRIANAFGMLLPTPKMVKDIWAASQVKLDPQPMVPNKGADLSQYADHSHIIDSQLASQGVMGGAGLLVSGQKKDVVISKLIVPGKVVIFGWYKKDGTRIQPRTNVHGDFYADYSHGFRLISPKMIFDGKEAKTEDVLKSPLFSPLLSDEGPLREVAYPTGEGAAHIATLYEQGTEVILALSERRSA